MGTWKIICQVFTTVGWMYEIWLKSIDTEASIKLNLNETVYAAKKYIL